MNFTVTVDGKQELLSAFLKVQQGTVDLRQLGAWDWVQSVFYKLVQKQFETEGAAGRHGKWQKLSAKYEAKKLTQFGSLPILQRSTALLKSATSEGAFGAVVNKKPQEIELGSTLLTARYHSSPEARKKIPLRRIYDFTEAQEKELMKPIQEKLKQLLDNAKLRDIRGF